MNVAVVGSRTFPLKDGAGYIFELISKLNASDKVVVRPSEGVDHIARVFAEALGIDVVEFKALGSRERVFERDELLVKYADRVEAFFDPENVMGGGTGHIVEVAHRMKKPVRAWTVENDELVLVGEDGDFHRG